MSEILKSVWGSINELVKLQEELVGFINPYLKNAIIDKYNNVTVRL